MERSIDLLVGFSRLVANADAPDQILPYLADAVVAQAPPGGVLAVRLQRSGQLVVAASKNLPEAAARWEADVTDVGFDIGEMLKAHLGERRAVVAHPLVSDRNLFGWLVLFLETPLPEPDAKIVQGLADVAAIALSQAVRTADLEEAHRRLKDEHTKLIQAEKLSSIGLLAAGVAHEINNPLAGVLGALNRLRAVRPPDPAEEQWFELMKEALDRIKNITRSLLDFARQRPVRQENVVVEEVLDSCIRLSKPAAMRRSIEIQLEKRGAVVFADRGQLMQSLMNVLLNAIHASPDGGIVRITAERAGERVGIRIVDQGPGIPESLRDKVCDPFFTTKPEGEGTGLGLSITLGLVEANEGTLDLGGSEGQGAEVTIWLPEGRT